MTSRIRDGRNPFLPDKNHIHHKLMRTGLNTHLTMLTLLALSMLFVIANYLMAAYISQTVMIVVDIVLFIMMHLTINYFIYKKENGMQEYQREYEIK